MAVPVWRGKGRGRGRGREIGGEGEKEGSRAALGASNATVGWHGHTTHALSALTDG